MDRYSISKDVLTNKTLFQSLFFVILVVKYVNGCSSEQYLLPRGNAVRMDCPIAGSAGYDRLVWMYQTYKGWITFITCYWQQCKRVSLNVHKPYFDIFQTYHNWTTVSVLIINITTSSLNISCMAQYHHIERVNCDWHILATKNILTLNSANSRSTTTMSTSTMRSTTHELSNVCLLSESGASVHYMSVSRQGPFNVSVSALNYHYTVWLVCTRQRTRNVGHCLPSISGLMRCFDSFSSDNPDFESRLETRGSNVFLVFERIKSNISELQVLCLHNTTHFKHIILWKMYISAGASVHYMSVSRQGPFNVSVSALNYRYTVWLVCTSQRARNVGQCSLSNSGLMRCFDSYSSDTPEFKTRLVTQGSNVYLVFERIKSNISELQVLFVQNTTHFKNIMLWKMYISDMDADQLSHQTTHDYDLKDHYEDFILPIIIVVPTSVLTLLVIIISTVRHRRSSASRLASSALRAALGNRGQVASPAVSSPHNDHVSLWLTTILARLQYAPAPRDGANPPPYDEPPPYDSLSLTEFHATDISMRTISIVHDGVSESNDSDPPPPYPGV